MISVLRTMLRRKRCTVTPINPLHWDKSVSAYVIQDLLSPFITITLSFLSSTFIFSFFPTLSFSLSPSWSMLVPSFLSVHSYIRGFSAYLLGGVSIAQTPQILPRPSGFHTAAKLQNSSCVQAVRGNSPIKNPKYQLCSSLILTGRESWPRTHCQEPG